MNRFSRKKWYLLLVAGVFPAVTAISALTAAADHEQVNFLPVNVSLICQSDTPAASRLIYQRATVSGPSVHSTECVDGRSSISNIHPEKVELVYRRDFGTWSIVIIANKDVQASLAKFSERWEGKKILVGVDGKAINTAILNGPLNEQKIYIGVDSEKFGNELLMTFVQPGM
jgi:hypothetical protein